MSQKRAANSVKLGAVLVQLWCNKGGKDGNYARNGRFAVNSIEGMDSDFHHKQDGHSQHKIRSQTARPERSEGFIQSAAKDPQ
jgi:hypothetical protein